MTGSSSTEQRQSVGAAAAPVADNAAVNNTIAEEKIESQDRIDKIRAVINQSSRDIRAEYPILLHQNAIGSVILAFAVLGMLASAALYVYGIAPAWFTICLSAFFAAFTHEIEHDLIHYMYFKNKAWAHHLMLAIVWLCRPSTMSPWSRRQMHLHHHQYAGTEHDLEEQAISNGMPWGIRRAWVLCDQLASMYIRPVQMFKMVRAFLNKQPAEERTVAFITQATGFFPLTVMHYGLLYHFFGFHIAQYVSAAAGQPIEWSEATLARMEWVNLFAVVLCLPNLLRTFSLQFISSNMHYFGDIDYRDVIRQTQVLNPWWLLPLQLFCCNFGSTHAIHHFVMKEPFYIRQLTASTAHKVMRENGVRFNDIGTFRRVNRYNEKKQE